MKTIYLFLISLISLNTYGQTPMPYDSVSKKFIYTEVVELPQYKKDQLYMKAKDLNQLGKGVKIDNKAEGVYSYSGDLAVTYPGPVKGKNDNGNVSYILTIACKDGKYKITITDFVHTGKNGSGGELELKEPKCTKNALSLNSWASIKTQTNDKIRQLIKNIKTYMQQP
ncbi:MAG: DUF4468 domain-containing protein [Cytophagaceae bacterium]